MVDELEPAEGDDALPVTLSRRSVDALVRKWKHIVISVIAGGGLFASYVGTDSLLAALAAVVPPDPKEVACCVNGGRVLDKCGKINVPPTELAQETTTCCGLQNYIGLSCETWRDDQ